MNTVEWALLALLSALWGGSFFFIGVAVQSLPPVTIVFLRVLIGAATLLVVLRVMGIRIALNRETIIAFAGMALLNNVIPFTLIVWAQGAIPSGLASILNATTPLFTVIVLHMFGSDERASLSKLAGVLVGFVGVAAMIGLDLVQPGGHPVWAQVAMLAATLSYGFSGLWGRRFARLGVQPVAAAAGQLSASTLLLLPLFLVFDRPWTLPWPPGEAVLAIVALALISTALAYVIFFRILSTAGATNLLLVTFLIPISAILLGALFLGERLEPKHGLGMALIGAGLALIDGRLPAKLRSWPRPSA